MNIEKYLNKKQIFQYKIISTEYIPFSQDVISACRSNKCGRYETCWTCPPGAGTLEELKTKIKSYRKAAVFTCKYELEDWLDFEGMSAGAKSTEKILFQITDELSKAKIPFLALGCEGCSICEKCTYPDFPCRFPNQAFISIEACGINVVELSRNIGINYNNGVNTVTYFCIILF